MITCNLNIEDLEPATPCENRISGVRRILFIPTDWVESINALNPTLAQTFEDVIVIGDESMTDQAVTVSAGNEFGSMRLPEGAAELKYTTVGQMGTRCIQAHLEVRHPVFKKKMLGFVSALKNIELFIFVETESGDWHLLGNIDRGCKMADGTEGTSGKVAGEAAVNLVWEIYMQFPKVMFEGWEPENETYGVEMYRVASLWVDEADEYLITDENGYVICLGEGEFE